MEPTSQESPVKPASSLRDRFDAMDMKISIPPKDKSLMLNMNSSKSITTHQEDPVVVEPSSPVPNFAQLMASSKPILTKLIKNSMRSSTENSALFLKAWLTGLSFLHTLKGEKKAHLKDKGRLLLPN